MALNSMVWSTIKSGHLTNQATLLLSMLVGPQYKLFSNKYTFLLTTGAVHRSTREISTLHTAVKTRAEVAVVQLKVTAMS